MLSYFAIALFLTLATHVWFERRLVTASSLPGPWAKRLRAVLAAHVVVLPVALVVCLRAPADWARWSVPVGRFAFLDEGFCLLLVASLAAREAAWLAARALYALRVTQKAPDLERRRALLALRGT